jgi:hypothetical protein
LVMLAVEMEFSALFIMVHLGVIGLLSALVYQHTQGRARYLGAMILLPWFAVCVALMLTASGGGFNSLISPLSMAMTAPLLITVVLWRVSASLRQIVAALPVHLLIGVQVYRVLGAIFYVGWRSGELPVAIGPVTALFDVTIGLTAPLVAYFAWSSRARPVVIAWNGLGLIDFAYAIMISLLAGPLDVLTLTPGPHLLGELPLSLIVVWAVPLSVMLHAFVLARMLPQADRPEVATRLKPASS